MLISSRQNEKIKQFLKVRSDAAANHPWFVVEGEKLLRELLRSPHEPWQVFVLDGWEGKLPATAAREIYRVTPEVMEKLSSLKSPGWVVTLCRRQEVAEPGSMLARTPWIVLDGIQDPGNVGTIFRTAEAFGISPVVLLPPSPSPFQEKVIRGSAGSSLRVPYWRPPDHAAFLEELHRRRMTLWALDPQGDVELKLVPSEGANAFLIGNEGHGPSPVLAPAVSRTVRIPIAAGVDSLNAAVSAALLLHRIQQIDSGPSPR